MTNIIPSTKVTALEALRFVCDNGLKDTLPNLSVALRILLTIPITVASGERSFSKLKLIKNYLRSSMSQDRLNSLALLSIEKDTAHSLSYFELVHDFAFMKARKGKF